MRPKPLEVTRTSLTTCYTGLCYSCSRNTYNLYKGLLIKYWWCLTNTSWTPTTSSSSTSHLHSSNGNSISMQYLYGSNTASRHYSYTDNIVHIRCSCIYMQCETTNSHVKSFFFTKILFSKISFFPKFCLILFDFILLNFFFFSFSRTLK